ncbi:ATP synthase F1 subunit epsilon [Fundicoccus culcitae]|uniref:ATP synthase epsilon chain n=1 Tax=Fundicoccus culcitae TaxID=2969821 RepID=A0ABY5P5H4_9LACT|nr:ATP synthase F1 subunit epsilon [Fundicoccus culcitae]UUX33992.1 ATP synthase F1 subunit epsilon [Fundicoccus culcitae]
MENQPTSYIQVVVYSPEGEIYNHRSKSCNVHTPEGGMSILANHMPIVASLDTSAIRVIRLDEEETVDYIAINGGILNFNNNRLEIATSYAIRARDIDEAKVELERQEAEAAMQSALHQHNTKEFNRAKIQLKRAINLITVSKERKN